MSLSRAHVAAAALVLSALGASCSERSTDDQPARAEAATSSTVPAPPERAAEVDEPTTSLPTDAEQTEEPTGLAAALACRPGEPMTSAEVDLDYGQPGSGSIDQAVAQVGDGLGTSSLLGVPTELVDGQLPPVTDGTGWVVELSADGRSGRALLTLDGRVQAAYQMAPQTGDTWGVISAVACHEGSSGMPRQANTRSRGPYKT